MKQLILLGIMVLSFNKPKQNERVYHIEISEHLINSYWLLIHGQEKKMTVEDYEKLYPELLGTLETQIVNQNKRFRIEDSLALVRTKKDTLTKK